MDCTGFSLSRGPSVLLLSVAVESGIGSVWGGTDEGGVSDAGSGEDDKVETVSCACSSLGCGLCRGGGGDGVGKGEGGSLMSLSSSMLCGCGSRANLRPRQHTLHVRAALGMCKR